MTEFRIHVYIIKLSEKNNYNICKNSASLESKEKKIN